MVACILATPTGRCLGQETASHWRLASAPDVRIGGPSGNLSAVSGVVVLPDESIAVIQPQDKEIRVFGPRGDPVGTLGRPGSGPGEFRDMLRYGVSGNLIWVWDRSLARMTLATSQGKFVSTSPFSAASTASDSPKASWLPVVGRFPNGDLLTVGFPAPSQVPKWASLSGVQSILARFSPGGTFQRVYLTVPETSECLLMTGNVQIAVPECATAVEAHAPDGSSAVVITSSIGRGTNGTITVVGHSEAKESTFVRTFPFTGVPLRGAVADSVRHAASATSSSAVVERIMTMPLPPVLRPARRALIGMDGSAWILLSSIGANTSWVILDRQGRMVGSLDVPRSFRILAAREGTVWGVDTDENGIESVLRYKLERSRPQR